MLVIKILLWPRGDHTRERELGVATISNVGGTLQTGNYEAVLLKSGEYSAAARARPLEQRATRPLSKEVWKRGAVEGFARQRLGPWDLLFRALGSLIDRRNPGVSFDAEVRGDEFGREPDYQHTGSGSGDEGRTLSDLSGSGWKEP